MPTSQFHKFVDMPGQTLPMQPPFPFEGMSTRVFPLRANIGALQRFVDSYLNIIPPEIGVFRVAAPYVSLMLLDYGKLTIKVGNYGWLAQREILFNINLEWYKVENGKWKFHDWATVAPYIFVDDDFSMGIGRTVYGWTKTTASLDPVTPDWLRDAQAPIPEALVRTSVFSQLYAGRRLERQPLVEVSRAAPMSLMRYPMVLGTPFAPWTMLTNLAQGMAGFSRDALGMLQGLGVVPLHPAASADNALAKFGKLTGMISPVHPNLVANTLNLKQFRRANKPDEYCFQAVTNGPMRFTGFNGGGVMGEDRLLAGDSSGGYTIKLHRWASLPIVETLGLNVDRQWQGPGCDVAELKPVLPFWYNVDMTYERGENLAWRTSNAVWHDRDGRTYSIPGMASTSASDTVDMGKGAPGSEGATGTKAVPEPPLSERLFNTTLGSANRTVAGPFHYTDTTIRVLPLLADRATLQKYLDRCFNSALCDIDAEKLPPNARTLDVWVAEKSEVATVYMAITSFGTVASDNDNIGDWSDFEVSFLVPVRRYSCEPKANGEWTRSFEGVGVVPAFNYVDNATAATANSEVLGIPTLNAQFVTARDEWMATDGPSPDNVQTLLHVRAEVLPTLGRGEKAQRMDLFRIETGQAREATDDRLWRGVADHWGTLLRGELKRKVTAAGELVSSETSAGSPATSEPTHDESSPNLESKGAPQHERPEQPEQVFDEGRRLALEILGNQQPISYYSLKQFRDVADPTLACYQAFLRMRRTITNLVELREIEEPLTLRIHEYPTQPIVRMLGLHGQRLETTSAGIVYGFVPQRPFWMTVSMTESLGEGIHFRSDTTEWLRARPKDGDKKLKNYFDVRHETRTALRAVGMLDAGDPRRIQRAALERDLKGLAMPDAESHPGDLQERRKRDTMVTSALHKLSPQDIADPVLSWEWGNWNPRARWRVSRAVTERKYDEEFGGVDNASWADEEESFFLGILDRYRNRPGQPPVEEELKMIGQLKVFSRLWQEMDDAWEAVNSFARKRDTYKAQDGLEHLRKVIVVVEQIAATPLLGIPDSPTKPAAYRPEETEHPMSSSRMRLLTLLLEQFLAMRGLMRALNLSRADGPHRPTLESEPKLLHSYRVLLIKSFERRDRTWEQLFDESTHEDVRPFLGRIPTRENRSAATWPDSLKEFDEEAKKRASSLSANEAQNAATLRTFLRKYKHPLRELVELARRRCEMQKDALLNRLSRGDQKPDYVVWRGSVGTESDRVFPLAQSWNDSWFAGALHRDVFARTEDPSNIDKADGGDPDPNPAPTGAPKDGAAVTPVAEPVPESARNAGDDGARAPSEGIAPASIDSPSSPSTAASVSDLAAHIDFAASDEGEPKPPTNPPTNS